MNRGRAADPDAPGAIERRSVLGVAAGAVAAAGVAPGLAEAQASGAGPVADTAYGKVRGYADGPIKVFKGVPYGADTGGANRWLPPKKPAPWTGIKDATRPGEMCPQNLGSPMQEETDMLQTGPIGENCLHLNIYTPAVGRNSGKRAVMVWFHGGGFTSGSGNATSYNGANLGRKKDVVVVTVTHRLNHFGFLYLADLYGPDYADSGNAGLLDLVAALEWVRDNIASFGGDPSRVMIFGQSGGGGKVSTLMGVPAAKGLFRRVTAESGSAVRSGVKAQVSANAKRLVDALGVTSLAELQATPWRKIVDAANANRGSGGSGPVVDGRTLPANVFDPQASPVSRDVPLMIGSTETESVFNGAPIEPIDEAGLHDRIKQTTRLSDADTDALIGVFRQTYPGKDNAYIGQLLMSQWTFTDGVTTEAERKAAQSAQGGAPTYVYYFTKHVTARQGKLHAPHTAEIPFVWDSLASSTPIVGPITPDKQAVADKLSAYWTNYAKTGDPNGPGLPHWAPFNLQTRPIMVLDDAPMMVDDPLHATRLAVAEYKTKAAPAPAAGGAGGAPGVPAGAPGAAGGGGGRRGQ